MSALGIEFRGSKVRVFSSLTFRLDSEQRHLDEQAMRQNVPKITLDKNIQVSGAELNKLNRRAVGLRLPKNHDPTLVQVA